MTGERETADLIRARRYIEAARLPSQQRQAPLYLPPQVNVGKCLQCDGMGIVVVDYGSPSQPVHELICDSCNGTGRG